MNKAGVSQDYINKVKKKYGKAIKFNKKSKKYEIDKNTDDYKKARKSTIKKAAIGTAAVVGGLAARKLAKDHKSKVTEMKRISNREGRNASRDMIRKLLDESKYRDVDVNEIRGASKKAFGDTYMKTMSDLRTGKKKFFYKKAKWL